MRAVIFSHWGGLTELTWTIDRASPQDLQLAVETLVDYMYAPEATALPRAPTNRISHRNG